MEFYLYLKNWLPDDPSVLALLPAVAAFFLSVLFDVSKRRHHKKLKREIRKQYRDNGRSFSHYSKTALEPNKGESRSGVGEFFRALKSYKALGYYSELGKRFFLFYAIAIHFVLFLAISIFLGGMVGYKVSFLVEGVEVRDISYGIGILVAAGVSFIATESGRHNKKHEITEKSLSSLRDVAGEFCQKVGEVRHLSRRARYLSKVSGSVDASLDKMVRESAVKQEDEFRKVSSELEKSIQEAITKWNIFEICYGSLSESKNGLPSIFKNVKSIVDNLSGVAHMGKYGREAKYAELAKGVDVPGLMKYVSTFISKKHAEMKKDYAFRLKVSGVCLIAFFLVGIYVGYIAGEGGFDPEAFFNDISVALVNK